MASTRRVQVRHRNALATSSNVDGASPDVEAHGLSVHGDLGMASAPVFAAMFDEPGLDQGQAFLIDLRERHSGHPAAFAASAADLLRPRVRRRADAAPDRVADLDVAVRYLPGGPRHTPTAGDFFDVLPLRTGQIAIVLGDVTGHGDPAIGRRAALRSAVRTLASIEPAPDAVLTALELFQSAMEPDDLATVWYGLYTPDSGELLYAAAGHAPFLLWVGGDADVTQLEIATTPMLGAAFGEPAETVHRVNMPPGSSLIGYSDGLIERPDRDIESQLEALQVAAHTTLQALGDSSPGDVADRLLDMFIPDPAGARDDVCLAVVARRSV